MEKEARKTMRVAVYCRLARADQDDTLLEVQKERLRIYAKERGYDIVAEIAEIGSGLSLNRPGIREMAGLAYRHMIDAGFSQRYFPPLPGLRTGAAVRRKAQKARGFH